MRPNSLAGASPLAGFSLRSKNTARPPQHAVPPYRQDPEEWRHIEEAVRARSVRPLRYVRQAALAAELPPCTRRRG
jgi:hypothetical protein